VKELNKVQQMKELNIDNALYLEVMRRDIDKVHQERLIHLETRLEDLDEWIRKELQSLDYRVGERLKQTEKIFIKDAADLAVKTAFHHMGVNVEVPAELENFRNDLRFGGVFRSAISKSFFALVAAVFGGIGLSLWLTFKDRLGWK
jgi:hypothetical protein